MQVTPIRDDDDAATIEEGSCLTTCCGVRNSTSGESQRKERRLNWRVSHDGVYHHHYYYYYYYYYYFYY